MIKAYSYDGTLLSTDRWINKKIICFGDSRFYYDGSVYWNYAKSEWAGKAYYSIQDVLRRLLGATVETNAQPGLHSYQICDNIKSFNFANYECVVLGGGVNDWNSPGSRDNIGAIEAIGSDFDLTTIYGNWQSAIEYILTNYPKVKIYLLTPYKAWKSNNEMLPASYGTIKKDIAELYNLSCFNAYDEGNINILNRDYFYADNGNYIHFNDYGNKLIGEMIAGILEVK